MLWKITNNHEVFYTEDAKEAEFCETGRGYTVDLYTKSNDDYRETHSPTFNVSLTKKRTVVR